MPFYADSRCGLLNITLNVYVICEELENLLEKIYDGDTDKGSKFWYYVYCLENTFTNSQNLNNSKLDFWDWFIDNYNNIDSWEDIEDNFKVEEEEEEEEEEDVDN